MFAHLSKWLLHIEVIEVTMTGQTTGALTQFITITAVGKEHLREKEH